MVTGTYETDGLSLPIYSHELTVVPKGKQNIQNFLSLHPGNTFFRAVMPFVPQSVLDFDGKDRLGRLLGKADREFSIISELCGGRPIPHEWGIWDMGDMADRYSSTWPSSQLELPENHLIVAEVATVHNHQPIEAASAENKQILYGLSKYEGLEAGDRLYDRYQQVVKGSIAATHLGPAATGLWWVDIEPRIRRHA